MLRGEELSAAYALADIFMMPSETETMGFLALEAMASGQTDFNLGQRIS